MAKVVALIADVIAFIICLAIVFGLLSEARYELVPLPMLVLILIGINFYGLFED